MSVERRKHPRVAMDVVVEIRNGDTVISGRLHDLSVDAALVGAPRAWPVGTSVDLRFDLPDRRGPLTLTGTVIRVAAGEDQAMAVLFTDLPPAAATLIDLFMARQEAQG